MSATLPPELKQVQFALQQHRRQCGRQRIPDTIRRQTVGLLSVYPRKQVVNTLGISYKMLCSWAREQIASGETSDSETIDFVSLPVTAAPPSAPDSDLPAIELRFASEVILAFHGAGATTQCLQLLQGLGYGREATQAHQAVLA